MLAALVVLFVVLLVPLNREITGFGDGNPIAIKKSVEIEETKLNQETLIYDKINMMCGVINNDWDYGKAFPITKNVTCNNICAVSGEDTTTETPEKSCSGLVSFDLKSNRYARKKSDIKLGDTYANAPHLKNYCCCK